MTDIPIRQQALIAFTGVTDIEITGLRQTGRELDTATFTLLLPNDVEVPIGPADRLWSRTLTSRALSVSTGQALKPCKNTDYENVINALVRFACDVQSDEQDSLAGRVRDYLDQYLRGATPHRERCAPRREPFIDEDYVYVSVQHLARWIRREYMDTLPDHLIRHALRTLGYTQLAVNFVPDEEGAKRTSASYYRALRT